MADDGWKDVADAEWKDVAPATPSKSTGLPTSASDYGTSLVEGVKRIPAALYGAGEAAIQATTGAASDIIGGWRALPDILAGEGKKAVQTSEQYKLEHTYQPKTEEGKKFSELGQLPMRAAGAAGEAVGGPTGRAVAETALEGAGRVAGAVGAVRSIGTPRMPSLEMRQHLDAIKDLQSRGWMADPSMSRPRTTTTVLESVGDRQRILDRIAAENAKKADQLTREEISLPPTAKLDAATLGPIKSRAEKTYDRIRQLSFDVKPDQPFIDAVRKLDEKFRSMKEFTPELHRYRDVDRISGALESPKSPAHPDAYTPAAILDISKNLRQRANNILRGSDIKDEAFHEAAAAKAAATALEDLLDRELKRRFASGTPAVQSARDLVDRFREDRKILAKINDIEDVTNLDTGRVNPQKLKKLRDQGHPLTGNLAEIARAASVLESGVVRDPSKLMGRTPISTGDVGMASLIGAAGAALMGKPLETGALLAGGVLARPGAQALASSKFYQKAMGRVKPPPTKPIAPISMREGLRGQVVQSLLSGQEDEGTNR